MEVELESSPRRRIERVFVERDGDAWRVASIPFAADLSLADRVEAEKSGERLRFVRVLERGGHSTIRLTLAEPQTEATFRELWAPFDALGLSCEATASGRLAIDVPPASHRAAVDALVDRGVGDGLWAISKAP